MKIIIIDKNKKLISAVKKVLKIMPYKNVSAKVGDIFKEKGIIVSASNPSFSCGGGLDNQIAGRYPDEAKEAQKTPGEMKRTKNVIWVISVDKDIKANRELVVKALDFAFKNIKDNETLLISGLGCGIGGLSIEEYVSAFVEALNKLHNFKWKFLKEGNISKNGDLKWIENKWNIHTEKLELCKLGFHASDRINQAFDFVSEEVLALVECGGKCITDDDKSVWGEMRIIKTFKWDKKKSVKLAIFAAEQVIDIFEKEYKNDKRPRWAIQAAKRWLKNPTEKNAYAAYAAYAAYYMEKLFFGL